MHLVQVYSVEIRWNARDVYHLWSQDLVYLSSEHVSDRLHVSERDFLKGNDTVVCVCFVDLW